jgi:hypothetical protein
MGPHYPTILPECCLHLSPLQIKKLLLKCSKVGKNEKMQGGDWEGAPDTARGSSGDSWRLFSEDEAFIEGDRSVAIPAPVAYRAFPR